MDEKFREREKSYEAKYKLEQEMRFKAESRRNKLLGLWAAERMGMAKDRAESYAKEIVIEDLEAPGPDDVVRRLMRDFAAHNVNIGEDEIRKQIARLYAVALDQVAKEYPEPLGPDHERVGG